MKIDRIEVFPFRYPMTGFFKFLTNARGATGRAAVIVKVTADDGTVGWGQSVPVEKWSYETLEASTVAIRDYYAPALIGHDSTDIEGAHEIMDHTIYSGFSTGMPITRAGIDIALHDLTGKLLGQLICSQRMAWSSVNRSVSSGIAPAAARSHSAGRSTPVRSTKPRRS